MNEKGRETGRMNVQVYASITLVASLVAALKDLGYLERRNYSYVGGRLFELMADVLEVNGKLRRFTKTDEALEFLKSEGFSVEQFEKRRRASLVRALREEAEELMPAPSLAGVTLSAAPTSGGPEEDDIKKAVQQGLEVLRRKMAEEGGEES